MQLEKPADLMELEKKAIKAAISSDWNLAKEFNLSILDIDSSNVDAKVRLGKAFLELRDYAKARKYCKEALLSDPINTVAQKNLLLAKEEKHSPVSQGGFKSLIKEPATYAETTAEIIFKGFTAAKISPGSVFILKVLSNQTKVLYDYKDQRIELAIITDDKIHRRLKVGKDQGAALTATFTKGTEKEMSILITSSEPIFNGEKQELKPYTKRDFMDSDNEPEVASEES